MIQVRPLHSDDRQAWAVLARGYKTFYETVLPDPEYERAWQRLMAGDAVFGLGAHLDGRLVGIVHHLFHASTWASEVCYLQDLFVDPAQRGQGVARALIEQVALVARERGAARVYWVTHRDNRSARALYDKLASHEGFIRYDHVLR